MDNRITIIVNGNVECGKEHNTIIKNNYGEELRFYTDGYYGVSYSDIKNILDHIGIGCFTVYRN